jgi:hypothetical protein
VFVYIVPTLILCDKQMSLLTSVNEASSNTPYYAEGFPSGIANNLSWSANAYAPLYQASISNISPFLTATSPVSAHMQVGQTNLSDGYNAWIVSAIPSSVSGGSITFFTAANPATPANFPISWSVSKF